MEQSGIWYHGSKVLFNQFRQPRKHSPQEQLGFGIHFAKDPGFAALYGNYIYSCKLHPRKILDVTKLVAVGTLEDKIGREFLRPRAPYVIEGKYYMNPDYKPPKRAEEIIRKYGYDSVFYGAKFGSFYGMHPSQGMRVTHKTPAVVMLNPNQIEIVGVKKIERKK